MHKLLRVLWSGKWTIVTPYSLLFSLWELLPAFKNYKQQVNSLLFNNNNNDNINKRKKIENNNNNNDKI